MAAGLSFGEIFGSRLLNHIQSFVFFGYRFVGCKFSLLVLCFISDLFGFGCINDFRGIAFHNTTMTMTAPLILLLLLLLVLTNVSATSATGVRAAIAILQSSFVLRLSVSHTTVGTVYSPITSMRPAVQAFNGGNCT